MKRVCQVSDLFLARPFRDDDLRPTLALVQSIRPDVDLGEWHRHIGTYLDGAATGQRCGAVVLSGPNDYVYGLFTYCLQRSLGIGCTLKVSDFCIATLTSRTMAADTLMAEADAIADTHGCRAVSITFLDDAVWHRDEAPHEVFKLRGSFVPAPPAVMKVIG